MRIRKNAKLSSSLQLLAGVISSSSSHASRVEDGGHHQQQQEELLQLLLQPHLCQLNQSPWDAPDSHLALLQYYSTAPSYPAAMELLYLYQYQWENSFTGTVNSLNNSAPIQEESFPDQFEPRQKEKLIVKGKKIISAGLTGKKKKKKKGAYCRKNDAKRHCKNGAPADEVCSVFGNAADKKGRKGAVARRRGKHGSASNPFYYYTGFGPSRRRRMGGGGGSVEEGQNGNFSSITDDVSSITSVDYTTSSSVNKLGIGDKDMAIVEEEEEYEDDDDDDDDEESSGDGKKRMRKPIKARSLKSLM